MNEKENGRLVRPFTMEELEKALKESKTNTTPALDGFPAVSIKICGRGLKD